MSLRHYHMSRCGAMIALHAVQLLHGGNTERAALAPRCQAFKPQRKCIFHLTIPQCAHDRFTSFLRLWKAVSETYNLV